MMLARPIADSQVSLAGRVMSMRASSSKMRFYDLVADGQKVQILAQVQ
jgi:lysyl-tRNA synthetase class 2